MAEKQIEKTSTLCRGLEPVIEYLQMEQLEWNRLTESHQKNVERYLTKRSVLLQKKDECVSKIRELGALPEDAYEKYLKVPTRNLVKELHKSNESLKKIGVVNKKAFEQYNSFTKSRESLDSRKQELDKSSQVQYLFNIRLLVN